MQAVTLEEIRAAMLAYGISVRVRYSEAHVWIAMADEGHRAVGVATLGISRGFIDVLRKLVEARRPFELPKTYHHGVPKGHYDYWE